MTFADCLRSQEAQGYTDVNVRNELDQILMRQESLELLTVLESSHKCSGLCTQRLFYFSRPLTDGPPATRCLEALKSDLQKEGVLAILTLAQAFLVFVVWVL